MQHALAAALLAAALASPSASAAAGPTVHIRDMAFVPASLTVAPGDKVTFVNDDDDAHTATADDNTWDSEGLPRAGRYSHVFAKAGTVKYHCAVHPMMHGAIVVKASS